MVFIEDYLKHQHKELLILLVALKLGVDLGNDVNNIKNIRGLMVKIAGKLRLHLSMEDKFLYPRLLESQNPSVVLISKKFIAEMGSLGVEFSYYINNWNNPTEIQLNYAKFTLETNFIFDKLKHRINEEDANLYHLI